MVEFYGHQVKRAYRVEEQETDLLRSLHLDDPKRQEANVFEQIGTDRR